MQQDAIERLNLRSLLLEPELSDRLEADPMLAAEVLTLMSTLPDSKLERIREIVRQVVEELERRLRPATQQALLGVFASDRPGSIPATETLIGNAPCMPTSNIINPTMARSFLKN